MYDIGAREVVLTNEELAKVYESGQIDIDLATNEYLIIKHENGDYIDRFKFDGKKLVKFQNKTINNNFINTLKPRNIKQQCLFDLLLDDKIPVKLITGGFGTGKTYVSVHYALHKLGKEEKKIVYIRNNIEVKDTKELGSLPFGVREKLLPYIMPIVDCVGGMSGLNMLESRDKIEYVHLGHVRGRNFSDSVIICSESQSLTREHVQLLLGRVGENSTIIFEGDLTQSDKKVFEDNNGIKALHNVLRGNELFGYIHLDKVERSKVAQLSSLF